MPYAALGRAVLARWQAGGSLAEALNAALAGRPIELAAGALRFVPQQALPPGEAYEAFVRRTACVPTRDNAHDYFNGLVWLHRPALKRWLNEMHGLSPQPVPGGPRGPLRDALTLLDENGALLSAPPPLAEALSARDWQRLFVALRPLWAQARLEIVGHALLEKLLHPRKPLCAHVLPAGAPPEAAALATKPFQPLPVLGVPGWWPANVGADFYADPAVFRPRRDAQTG